MGVRCGVRLLRNPAAILLGSFSSVERCSAGLATPVTSVEQVTGFPHEVPGDSYWDQHFGRAAHGGAAASENSVPQIDDLVTHFAIHAVAQLPD